MTIRTMIVEDEPLARKTLAMLLAEDPEIEVVGEGAAAELAASMATLRPDLLFLDIQMPEMSGFELLDRLDPASLPAVVFVTAWDRYAVEAFDRDAVDYLLKPFDDARFHKALRRAKEQLRRPGEERAGRTFAALDRLGGHAHARRILVTHRGGVAVVPVAEIDWIEAADYYVRIHAGSRSLLHRESMADLEARLDPARFCRVHRSALVAVDRIREVRPDAHGEWLAALRDGTEVRISRSRRARLEQLLGR